MFVAERGTGFGDTWSPSISSRAGGVSWSTWTGPVPPGQPVGAVAEITAVGTEFAVVEPREFRAVIRIRSVEPTSAPRSA